ncbi:MAG: energy transducer TonB, partial [Pyrinomonadaceae bacterium]
YGLPNSTNAFGSNGRGKGGGQGEGDGTGQGGGRGGGAGNGDGTGFGDGRGDGTGDGDGDGNNSRRARVNPEPKEPPSAGPSSPLNITYKPKPKYTDEARQKNITGNVRVRVTFSSSGQIGSVSPVSNLGYGLTEQAIAAAKQMKFEPQLQNGRPVTVTKVVVFTFTIY